MVNIGILGSEGVGKTSILRLLKYYIENNISQKNLKIDLIAITKTDFSGEAKIEGNDRIEHVKTIHPNRLVFKIYEKFHTLFAPGGDFRRVWQQKQAIG